MGGGRPPSRAKPVWRKILVALPVALGIAWMFASMHAAQVSASGFFIRPAIVRPMAPLITTTVMPKPGSIVPFESLEPLTGQHIDVATRHGTLRRGTLRLVGPHALELELDRPKGGVRLTMPSNTITEIRYTPPVTRAEDNAQEN